MSFNVLFLMMISCASCGGSDVQEIRLTELSGWKDDIMVRPDAADPTTLQMYTLETVRDRKYAENTIYVNQ